MLRVESVYKSFGDFTAVKGAELRVGKGELVAVIGPNGAGKTTLFNLISGQLRPDRGKILFKDRDITGLPPHKICRQGIARSFQIANIFHRLTVFRNVQVAIISRQKKEKRLFKSIDEYARVETEAILRSVGLYEIRDRIAGTLSHGEQRILEIAIALGNEPELLILDEPTAGMSSDETKRTMGLIKELSEARGLTILFCEHDMDVVFNVADQIMVMHHGETLIQDIPERVKADRKVQEAYLGGE